MLFVFLLLILIVVGLATIYHLSRDDPHHVYHEHNAVFVHRSELTARFANPSGHTVLSGTLWKNSGPRGRPYDCSDGRNSGDKSRGRLCLLWRNARRLEIEHFDEESALCTRIRWNVLSAFDDGSECFQLGDGVKWFGAGLLKNSSGTTLENASIPRQAFVTAARHAPGAFGPVLERFFLSSDGVAIVVEANNSSFDLSVNEFDPGLDAPNGQLCLHRSSPAAASGEFAYLVCIADSITKVRNSVLSLLAPNSPPPALHRNLSEIVSGSPVWSTWAYFKDRFNHSSLYDFADQIADKFNGGTKQRRLLLMIDEGWESSTGDLEFTTSKFADPSSTIDALHSMGFRVSLGVRAQVSTDSAAFRNATVQRRLVQVPGADDRVPALARRWTGPREPRWDRGLTAAYDLTDPAAYEAFRERLAGPRAAYGVDAFHVGGTEVSSLPVQSGLPGPPAGDPNDYTRRGFELASDFGPLASAEAAAGGQGLVPGAMIRLRDRESSWSGLQSVIPDALTMGLLGYPLFTMDSVGGSAYNGFPTKELYLRWFQASAFLPVVHLSIPPWHYDTETEAAVRNILEIREALVLPEIRSILEGDSSGSIRSSSIVRPIWWLDPADGVSLAVTTEFLVGNSILVAPVLEEGMDQRDVYLPKGSWKDPDGKQYRGPAWVRGYAANLTCVPYFIRV